MKHTPSLDDLALFVAIADAGGLAGAARATGTSAPTLGRRMTALESALGDRLFHRGPRGYALTHRGRALLDEAQALRGLRAGLARFAEPAGPARVRITAGTWTARFIARHLPGHLPPSPDWLPEFVAAHHRLDIARREADIGVRNIRPEQPWLGARRTARIDYALYATGPEVAGVIATTADTPSSRWLRTTLGDAIVTTVNDARLARDLARGGVGRVVLPCFAAQDDPLLVRVSEPIDTLTHEEWLVAHHEARHDPPVRAALDCLAAILTDRALRGPA